MVADQAAAAGVDQADLVADQAAAAGVDQADLVDVALADLVDVALAADVAPVDLAANDVVVDLVVMMKTQVSSSAS